MVQADQRGWSHHRVCWQGFARARMHSYGKGRVGVGFLTADWVIHMRRIFWLSWAIVCTSAMRRPEEAMIMSPALRWWIRIFIWLYFFPSFKGFWELAHYGIPYFFLNLFLLGACTLCKRRVMIRCLGHWNAMWVPVYNAIVWCGRVQGTIIISIQLKSGSLAMVMSL